MPDETLNSPSETNGAPNGAANGAHAVHATSNEPTTADATTPPKEIRRSTRQKKRDCRREQAATPAIVATPEPVTLAVPEAPVDEPAEAPAVAEGAVAASEDPVVMAPSPKEPAIATASSEVPAGDAPGATAPLGKSTAPQEALAGNLRLRSKVWTDRLTGKRYLMPTAFMRDVVKGQPVSDAMYAYAMRDDDTKLVTLTAREWNALPFFYFHEDGPAPRATARPVDVIR